MRKAVLSAALLLAAPVIAAPIAVSAHGGGAMRVSGAAETAQTLAPVRNVSVVGSEAADCHSAIWPDIPLRCLTRAPNAVLKGDRVAHPPAVASEKRERLAAVWIARAEPTLVGRLPIR